MPSDRSRISRQSHIALLIAALAGFVLVANGRSATPRFFPDDPIQVDDDRAFDASGAASNGEGSNTYDFAENTFFKSAAERDIAAVNVNTMDEVPDSTWFTNGIGRQSMSVEQIVRGPDQFDTVIVDGWPINKQKTTGVTPGFRVVNPSEGPRGHLYQIKFDPPEHPEMSIGAEVIGAAIYHALGYNVVEGYIVEVDPAKIVIAPGTKIVDMTGRGRPMRREDVDRVLSRAARLPNGKYRAIASRYADGVANLGHFKYYGTRPDDPNDIYPHEHRRELRANRVFAAWLNHDDSRAINSLDMLDGPPGHQYIRHYMFDFGSIMGSGSTVAQVPRAGNEYLLEWKPSFLTLATLGLYMRPWITVKYPQVARSVGRFEADFFDPLQWKPEYPNPAFDRMRPEDAFWAARLVAKFSDETIRALVAKARYSERGAAEYVSATLIKRRDKVLKTWLTVVNPIAEPKLGSDGTLTFENAAISAAVASPRATYVLTWSRFDNATGAPVGRPEETRVNEPRAVAPAAVILGSEFLEVSIQTLHPDYPAWARPVRVHFRRSPEGWRAVGLNRTGT